MPFYSHKKFRRGALGCLALLSLSVAVHSLRLLDRREQVTLDLRYRHFNRETYASPRVVMLDIDEQSLKALEPHYGRWPWPRRVFKDVLEFLSIGKPAGVFFDILFTERMKSDRNDDALLAQLSASLGNISHAMLLLKTAEEEARQPPLPKGFSEKFGIRWEKAPPPAPPISFGDFSLPLPANFALVPNVHVVNFDQDDDGYFRRAPLFFRYGDTWIPSMGLAGMLAFSPGARLDYEAHENTLTFRLPDGKVKKLPLDETGALPLHFYRRDRGPESIPFAAAVQSALQFYRGQIADPENLPFNPSEVEGKVVLIGSSAAFLEDLKPTPVHPALPGALLQATAISNFLDGDHLKETNRAAPPFLALLLLVPIYFCLFYFEHVWLRLLLPLAIIGATQVFAVLAFRFFGWHVGMALPLLAGGLAWLDGILYISFIEGAERRRMKSTLSKYLSPTVMHRLLAARANPQAEVGRQEEVTVLFSDIRGFTTLSENREPRDLVESLNEYLGKMTDVLFAHNGTLDKFIGDSILAFWGAPLRDDFHAMNALRCAMAMGRELEALNKTWSALTPARPTFRIGIGINSGPAIVGNIGSEKHLDYTVVGDTVNIASRLEDLTKTYKVFTLIGEATYEKVKNSMICRRLDEVQVKGRSRCVIIYEPLTETSSANAEECRRLAERFHEALAAFERKDFASARQSFRGLAADYPDDGPTRLYLERCEEWAKSNPEIPEKRHAHAK